MGHPPGHRKPCPRSTKEKQKVDMSAAKFKGHRQRGRGKRRGRFAQSGGRKHPSVERE